MELLGTLYHPLLFIYSDYSNIQHSVCVFIGVRLMTDKLLIYSVYCRELTKSPKGISCDLLWKIPQKINTGTFSPWLICGDLRLN